MSLWKGRRILVRMGSRCKSPISAAKAAMKGKAVIAALKRRATVRLETELSCSSGAKRFSSLHLTR
jgi:hypothetical protein